MIDLSLGRKLIALEIRKRALKDIARQIQSEIDHLNSILPMQYAENGIQNIKIGGKTTYLTNKINFSVRVEDVESLADTEFAPLMAHRINAQTLTSYINERLAERDSDEGVEYIDNLPDVIRSNPMPKIVVMNITDDEVESEKDALLASVPELSINKTATED